MHRIAVSRFQAVSGLSVLDCGKAAGYVDSDDKFFEAKSDGLREVPFAEAESRFDARLNSTASLTTSLKRDSFAPGASKTAPTSAPGVSATPGAGPAALSNDQLLFCLNKSPERIKSDFASRTDRYDVVIGTKASQEQFEALKAEPSLRGRRISFDEVSRVLTVEKGKPARQGLIVIAAAGADDLSVAEEAARIADAMGNQVERMYDFEGASPAQAKKNKALLKHASAIIAVSGEDEDLPNAIAALTDRPIIAAPTSERFGEGLEGTEHLMDMMAASADGVSVVNTDNGFGAAYVADKINRQTVEAASIPAWQGKGHTGGQGLVVVTTAGSADIPVAEKAALEAERLGDKVLRLYDRGVNDPDNVVSNEDAFKNAKAVIVAAGLEGGLPNGVAALTQRPVIAVPTSVGYGTGKGGVASLMCALNACSPGISVVSIDDSNAAAAMAHKINAQSSEPSAE